MDSKLRLQIVTALDNAGIKATEQQINNLGKSIQDINNKNKGTFSDMEKALGKQPGLIGKISSAMGGVGAKVGLIIGALQAGVSVGKEISEFLKDHWKWYGDIFKHAERHAKAVKKQREEFEKWVDGFPEAQEKSDKYWEKQIYNAERLTKEIQKETKALIQQVSTRNELLKAGDNAEMIRLARAEFEDAITLEDSGASQETIDQLHAIYDVYRKELQIKQQINQFDEQNDSIQAKILKKQQEMNVAKHKEYQQQYAIIEARKKLEEFENDPDTWRSKNYETYRKRFQARINILEKNLHTYEDEYDARALELKELQGQQSLIDQNRSNLFSQLTLDRDKSAWEYDRLVANNGNLLGLTFNDQFIKELNDSSVQSYNELKEITRNTYDLAQKLDSLLGLKQ